MIRYLIIDDEPLAHDLIIKFAAELPYLQLQKQCYNALEALDYLAEHQVDLLFLDLNMPKLRGFDFLRTLRNPPKVIVTTAYQEHALEGFELSVSDYLLKPFPFERFVAAVHKVRKSLTPTPPKSEKSPQSADRIFVKSDKKYHQISLDDILFIAAYGNYTKIYLPERMILNHDNISSVLASLPASNFLRVHKSYIVALDKINAVEGNQILLPGHKIPIGQTYRAEVGRIVRGEV